MARRKFEFIDDVEATWEILDRLARMVWEHDKVSSDIRKRVHEAACNLHTELRNAAYHLPRREQERRAAPPRGADIDVRKNGSGFRAFSTDRIAQLTISNGIESLADAFVKGTATLEEIAKTVGDGTGGFLFRGQRNIEWPLVPTLGRNRDFLQFLDGNGEQELLKMGKSMVSSFEIEALSQFKKQWPNLASVDPIDRGADIPEDDAAWWFRMQHYDENAVGTRLLDVTSSIPAALLFACLDWSTGLVDDETDGVLYLFSEGMNAVTLDLNREPFPFTTDNLFHGFHDVAPVHVLNPPHNERSKAQYGSFIWWPKFWEELPSQIFYLRVPKERKRYIAAELLKTNFGPKDIVRGEMGRINELNLREQLGL